MAQGVPLLRLSHIFRVSNYLKSIGFDPDPLLEQHRIPKSHEETNGCFILIFTVANFMKQAIYQTGMPDCMLRASLMEEIFECYAPEVFMSGTCTNTKELLQLLCFNAQKQSSTLVASLMVNPSPKESGVPFLFISDSYFAGNPHAELYRIGTSIQTVRMFTKKTWSPKNIYLQEDHSNKDLIQNVLPNSCIHYGSSIPGFDIPQILLASAPNLEKGVIARHVEEYPGADLITSLKQLLKTYLTQSNFTIESAAEHSLLSVRTLQRILARQMTNYSRLLSQTRFEVGRELLEQSDMPITEIAFSVGYADPTRFTHVFRSRTGMSPRDYRKQLDSRSL